MLDQLGNGRGEIVLWTNVCKEGSQWILAI